MFTLIIREDLKEEEGGRRRIRNPCRIARIAGSNILFNKELAHNCDRVIFLRKSNVLLVLLDFAPYLLSTLLPVLGPPSLILLMLCSRRSTHLIKLHH